MRGTIAICIAVGFLSGTIVPASGRSQGRGAPQDRHAAVRRDVDAMTARMRGPRSTTEQVIADAQRLTSGYRSIVPYVGGFGPADYALNRELARLSLAWLGTASLLYGRDPLAARAFLGSYDAIGGFYCNHGPFYLPGAFVAYAGATRLAQRLVLEGRDANWFENEMERFAMAYGTLAAYNGALQTSWTAPHDLPQSEPAPPKPSVTIKPIELPQVDIASLDAEQKGEWVEVQERFRSVAPRVHEAQILLNDLSERLQQQQITLHPVDAANALKMQSYLEDAVDLVRAGRFDIAIEALTRADYVRTKLRSVTGQ